MKELCFNYLFELYDHTSEVCATLELELNDGECTGHYYQDVSIKLEAHTKRRDELWQCLKFLKAEQHVPQGN